MTDHAVIHEIIHTEMDYNITLWSELFPYSILCILMVYIYFFLRERELKLWLIVDLILWNCLRDKLIPMMTYFIAVINSHSLTNLSLSLKKCSLSFYRETGKRKILLELSCLLDRLWPPEEDIISLSANYSKSGSLDPGYI